MLNEQEAKPFTAEDIRFTRKDDALYAILLDWPSGETEIRSLGTNATNATIERVEMLGGAKLQFRRDSDALRLTMPSAAEAFVPALRIRGKGLA